MSNPSFEISEPEMGSQHLRPEPFERHLASVALNGLPDEFENKFSQFDQRMNQFFGENNGITTVNEIDRLRILKQVFLNQLSLDSKGQAGAVSSEERILNTLAFTASSKKELSPIKIAEQFWQQKLTYEAQDELADPTDPKLVLKQDSLLHIALRSDSLGNIVNQGHSDGDAVYGLVAHVLRKHHHLNPNKPLPGPAQKALLDFLALLRGKQIAAAIGEDLHTVVEQPKLPKPKWQILNK